MQTQKWQLLLFVDNKNHNSYSHGGFSSNLSRWFLIGKNVSRPKRGSILYSFWQRQSLQTQSRIYWSSVDI